VAIYSVEGESVVRLDLSDITGYEVPPKSLDVTGVRVRTRDGFRFLRVAGTFLARGKNGEALARAGLDQKRFSSAWAMVQVILAIARANASSEKRASEDSLDRSFVTKTEVAERLEAILPGLQRYAAERAVAS
jgi:hypothetical protein